MKNKSLLRIFISIAILSHVNIKANPSYNLENGFLRICLTDVLPESLYQFVGKPSAELIEILESNDYELKSTEVNDDLTTKTGRKVKVRSLIYGKKNNKDNKIIISSRLPKDMTNKELVSHIECYSEYDNSKMSKSQFEKINVIPHITQLELFGFKKTDRDEDYVFLSKGKPGTTGYIQCQFSHGRLFYIEFSIED